VHVQEIIPPFISDYPYHSIPRVIILGMLTLLSDLLSDNKNK